VCEINKEKKKGNKIFFKILSPTQIVTVVIISMIYFYNGKDINIFKDVLALIITYMIISYRKRKTLWEMHTITTMVCGSRSKRKRGEEQKNIK